MSDQSKIEWTDASWNPIRAMHSTPAGIKLGWHCEHKSEGCRNCYAESFNRRLGTGFDYKPGHLKRPGPFPGDAPRGDISLFLDEKMLEIPLRWRRPRKIFVCSMTDLFADFVEDAWLDRIFAIMALGSHHRFQVLTKRPERARAYLRNSDRTLAGRIVNQMEALKPSGLWNGNVHQASIELASRGYLPNVWLGVSVEDQAAADERIPLLLDTPAAIRWLSMEPLLAPVDLFNIRYPGSNHRTIDATQGLDSKGCAPFDPEGTGIARGIDWIVAGGESGPNARPMHPDWARSIRDQCEAADVPFLFKQNGAFVAGGIARGRFLPENGPARDLAADGLNLMELGGGWFALKVGKKAAGRELDGIEHNGYPA